tara:strand:- start:2455 stop:5007 length:2553 start_codon:yes stop_codon:yes gene_type:complete
MNLYENIRYFSSIKNKKIILKFTLSDSEKTFNEKLINHLDLSEDYSIYIESFIISNIPIIDTNNSNTSCLILNLDNLNLDVNVPIDINVPKTSNLNSISVTIPNISKDVTKIYNYIKNKKYDFISQIPPTRLTSISGSLTLIDGSVLTGTQECILELLFVPSNKKKILNLVNKNFYENTRYFTNQSKNLVIKAPLLSDLKSFDINLNYDHLKIDNHSEIYLDSISIRNINNDLDIYGNNIDFLLKINELHVKSVGMNNITHNKILIPNKLTERNIYTTDNFRTGILDSSLGDSNSKLYSYGPHFSNNNTTHINTGFGNRTAVINNVNEMSIDLSLPERTTNINGPVTQTFNTNDHYYQFNVGDLGVETGMSVTKIGTTSYNNIFVIDVDGTSVKIYTKDSITISGGNEIKFKYTSEQNSKNLRLINYMDHTTNTDHNYPNFLLIPNPLDTYISNGENNHPTIGLKDSITLFLKNTDPPNSWFNWGLIHKANYTSWESWYTSSNANDAHATYNNKIVFHSGGHLSHGGHKLNSDKNKFKYHEEVLTYVINDPVNFDNIHNRIVLDTNSQNESAGSGSGDGGSHPNTVVDNGMTFLNTQIHYRTFLNNQKDIYFGLTLDYIENYFTVEVDESSENIKLIDYTFFSDDWDENELIYEGMHVEFISGDISGLSSSILNYSFINEIFNKTTNPTFTISQLNSLTSSTAYSNYTFTSASKMIVKIYGQILRFRWHPKIDSSAASDTWTKEDGPDSAVSKYKESNVKKLGPDHIVLPKYYISTPYSSSMNQTESDIKLIDGWAFIFGDTGSANNTPYIIELVDSSEIGYISPYQKANKKTFYFKLLKKFFSNLFKNY